MHAWPARSHVHIHYSPTQWEEGRTRVGPSPFPRPHRFQCEGPERSFVNFYFPFNISSILFLNLCHSSFIWFFFYIFQFVIRYFVVDLYLCMHTWVWMPVGARRGRASIPLEWSSRKLWATQYRCWKTNLGLLWRIHHWVVSPAPVPGCFSLLLFLY